MGLATLPSYSGWNSAIVVTRRGVSFAAMGQLVGSGASLHVLVRHGAVDAQRDEPAGEGPLARRHRHRHHPANLDVSVRVGRRDLRHPARPGDGHCLERPGSSSARRPSRPLRPRSHITAMPPRCSRSSSRRSRSRGSRGSSRSRPSRSASASGPGVTGVLQSTLGNLPEFFVVVFALSAGELVVAQTSIVGSIFANALLVLGLVIARRLACLRRRRDALLRAPAQGQRDPDDARELPDRDPRDLGREQRPRVAPRRGDLDRGGGRAARDLRRVDRRLPPQRRPEGAGGRASVSGALDDFGARPARRSPGSERRSSPTGSSRR